MRTNTLPGLPTRRARGAVPRRGVRAGAAAARTSARGWRPQRAALIEFSYFLPALPRRVRATLSLISLGLLGGPRACVLRCALSACWRFKVAACENKWRAAPPPRAPDALRRCSPGEPLHNVRRVRPKPLSAAPRRTGSARVARHAPRCPHGLHRRPGRAPPRGGPLQRVHARWQPERVAGDGKRRRHECAFFITNRPRARARLFLSLRRRSIQQQAARRAAQRDGAHALGRRRVRLFFGQRRRAARRRALCDARRARSCRAPRVRLRFC